MTVLTLLFALLVVLPISVALYGSRDTGLKVIDHVEIGDQVRYAYVGSLTPEVLEEGEVVSRRTESSYTVSLGTDSHGLARYRTRSYTAPTFIKDGGDWHVIEYDTVTKDDFKRLTRASLLERIAKALVPPTYAVQIFSHSGDGFLEGSSGTWAGAQAAGFVEIGDDSWCINGPTTNCLNAGAYFESGVEAGIIRIFLPFDTSSIPSGATISAATLGFYVTAKITEDNDGSDFVTVVETSQSDYTSLGTGDFLDVGSTEGVDSGQRVDISSASTGAYATFALNATGLSWIKKSGQSSSCHGSTTGITCLGLREGHDFLNSPLDSGTWNSIEGYSSARTGTSQDPYLDVTYSEQTFPVFETATTTFRCDQRPVDINLPSGITAGDALFIAVKVGYWPDNDPTISGWTRHSVTPGPDWNWELSVFSKEATGSEGSTVSMSYDTDGGPACIAAAAIRVSGHDGWEVSSANADDPGPDAPNLVPAAGSQKYLWLAVGGSQYVDNVSPAAPTNYTMRANAGGDMGEGYVRALIASRELEASSENPGSFGLGSGQWDAIGVTIAVKGGGGSSEVAPTVTTVAADDITNSSATLNGNITTNGGAAITGHGFAWGTSSSLTGPNVATTTLGSGTEGGFDEIVSGLTKGATYYFRAYAENSEGISFGTIESFAAFSCGFGSYIGGGQCRGYLTTADSSPWSVPADWNSSTNTVEVIGGGGGGGASTSGGGGGGGGAYAIVSDLALTGGSTAAFGVGTGGTTEQAGGGTWFGAASYAACVSSTTCVKAAGGGEGSNATAGSGGSTGVGTVTAGGTGGAGTATGDDSSGGGGGAGGPNGVGANGGAGDSSTTGQEASGGGGGASGGDVGAAGGVDGGAGGANFANRNGSPGGGGAGGVSSDGAPGSAGSGGGGGDDGFSGGAGGNGNEWDATHGAGGGGGGGGDTSDTGGNGGLYGGGGGGVDAASGAGTGGNGIIVITYEPLEIQLAAVSTNDTPPEIKSDGALLAATLTDTGGATGAGTNHGFRWGTGVTLVGGDTKHEYIGPYAATGTFQNGITGLTPNTTYYYRAFADNGTGTSTGSIESFLTLPGAPGAPTFTNITDTDVRVLWTAPGDGAVSYALYRCAGADCTNFALVDDEITTLSGSDHYYDDSGLTRGTVYRYRVRGENTTGLGDVSAASTLTTHDADLPRVTTHIPEQVTTESATLVGEILEASATGGGSEPTVDEPPALADMAAWYRGDSLVGSGEATGWNDKSGNGLHLDVFDAVDGKPDIVTDALNGKTVARFEQNNIDLFESDSVGVAEAPATIVIIGYCTGDNNDGHFFDSANGGSGNVIACGDDASVVFWAEADGAAGPMSLDEWHLIQVDSPNSTGTIYVDGTQVASGNSGALNLESGIRIGAARIDDSQYLFDGDIAEVIIYDKVLDSTEKEELEQYVYDYYGIGNGSGGGSGEPSGDGIVDRIGDVQDFGSTFNSDSEDVSVPEDAELMVLVASGWPGGQDNYYSGGTVTLGGNAMTLGVDGDGTGDGHEGSLYYIDVRNLEGTRTLAWDWSGSFTGGCIANFTYAFYKDVDMTSPIRDSGVDVDEEGPFGVGTLTAQEGDMIIAELAATSNTSVSWTGVSSAHTSTFSCGRAHYAEASSTGNTAVSVSISAGDDDGSLMAVVLAAAEEEEVSTETTGSQHGFVWGTDSSFVNNTSTTTLGTYNEAGEFTYDLTGLSSGTTYYVRAYATNDNGTTYGETRMFITYYPTGSGGGGLIDIIPPAGAGIVGGGSGGGGSEVLSSPPEGAGVIGGGNSGGGDALEI